MLTTKPVPFNVQDPDGPICYETLLWNDDVQITPFAVKVAHIPTSHANEFVVQEG